MGPIIQPYAIVYGFGVLWVYMSQYWHFGPFSHIRCARGVEVLKMVSFCFEPVPFLIKGLKAISCLHAKAQSPSPLGTGDTILESSCFGRRTLFWTTMVPNSFSPHWSLGIVCARYPRLRAIWKGYKNPPGIGHVPMYLRLGMGDPWVAQYGVCCCLPFFVYQFSAEGKNN